MLPLWSSCGSFWYPWPQLLLQQGTSLLSCAINDIIKSPLVLQRSPAISNPRASIIRMASAQMGGKVLVWDVTCPDTLALSYATFATREAGMVTEEAERKKGAMQALSPRSQPPLRASSRGVTEVRWAYGPSFGI